MLAPKQAKPSKLILMGKKLEKFKFKNLILGDCAWYFIIIMLQ